MTLGAPRITRDGDRAGWQTYLELLAQGLAAPDAVLVDDAAWDARFAQLRPAYDERFAALRD